MLFEEILIKGKKIKNRVCLPPMVCASYSDSTGKVSDKNVEHYRNYAKEGVGLLIQESTSILPTGKVTPDMMGVWSDEHIEGLSKIAKAVHEENGVIVAQVCHGGVVAIEDDDNLCSSDYHCVKNGKEKSGRAMTLDEIHTIQDAFVMAAVRLHKAGYDGVELHGCHRYLISQFLNTRVNQRQDAYGQEPELFALEIIQKIKDNVPEDFIIGMRLGAFEPTLEDSIHFAKIYENAGLDFLNISYGCSHEFDAYKPQDYPFKDVIYGAQEIKRAVDIPVFAVNGIRTPEEAEDIIKSTGVDMIAIGRALLVNPSWVLKAKKGEDVGKCYECKVCKWHSHPEKCPGRILMTRQKR